MVTRLLETTISKCLFVRQVLASTNSSMLLTSQPAQRAYNQFATYFFADAEHQVNFISGLQSFCGDAFGKSKTELS